MATTTNRLSFAEFQLKYAHSEGAYEYWHGEAIPKGMPTWIHGFLQAFISQLLFAAGFKVGGDVELRIAPDLHPRPDVVATKGKLEIPYPTTALEFVVEILSPDDSMRHILRKCDAYAQWGAEFIYVVDPEGRKVYRWTGQALQLTPLLVSIEVNRIWNALDQALA